MGNIIAPSLGFAKVLRRRVDTELGQYIAQTHESICSSTLEEEIDELGESKKKLADLSGRPVAPSAG